MTTVDQWRAGWKRWRRIPEGSQNMSVPPWRGAVGIEEIDDDLAVPAIVCWFPRGWSFDEAGTIHLADHVIALHNAWCDERDNVRERAAVVLSHILSQRR